MLHTRTLKSREKGRKDHRGGREEGDREVYGKGRFQLVNSDGKRKRIYADQYGDQGTTNRKAATSETKRSYRKVEDTTVQVSSGKWNTKVNEVGTFDGDRNSLLKKQTKSKFESVKANQLKYLLQFSNKKSVQRQKSLADSETMDDQPHKRKRIRLDPYDTSNKRLDDGIISDESTKERKKELEKDAGMSMNNFLGRRRLIELKRAGYNTDLSAPLDNIPFSTSSERERIEENIFRNKLTFFAAAKVSSSFPPPGLPEIAFAGRSNVGKSSLLNSLTRQWGVARTSDKPGLTQTINFFELGNICLVDLPGYGFAYAKRRSQGFLGGISKGPRDRELIDLMERYQTKYQIVMTKTDLVFPIDVARRTMQIEESLKANKSLVQPVMMVSSKSGAGIRSLRTVLSKIGRFAKL
ncbi:hypothetical protein OIU77_006676 [Salix suchowensis]|uniref:EngB-type G domain-containing protein n=1 Tax=Salix suchowensis TaxID=1278906 RepID=A0ABQ9ALH1_9ROSI|nr:hypothetical protein OIU77_006676 [Salix suchowensis]